MLANLTPPPPPRFRCLQGKQTHAEARYREALWLLEASFGDDHPLLATVLIDVAEAKTEQLRLLAGSEVD